MQNSNEILNFQSEKALSSLKVLVVVDKSNLSYVLREYYYSKAMDLGIKREDIDFIDTKEFLDKYHSKDDFKMSLEYSDIILLSLNIDIYKDTFIEEYIDFNDYYNLYPKLIYMSVNKSNSKSSIVTPPYFKKLLSYTNLAKERNFESVKEVDEAIHINGEEKPYFYDSSSIDKSLPLKERLKQEDKLYKEECKKELKKAKKILLVAITRDKLATNLLGIYEVNEIDKVREYAASLEFKEKKESPYFEVAIMYIDSEGKELPYIREVPWAINHYLNVSPGPFNIMDKIEIQKSLGNIN